MPYHCRRPSPARQVTRSISIASRPHWGRNILKIKKAKGLSWEDFAANLGQAPVWTCAACLGQMSMSTETATKAAALFGLNEDEAALLTEAPYRGCLPLAIPTGPLIYRFYELITVIELPGKS
jgi:cyanate lyase